MMWQNLWLPEQIIRVVLSFYDHHAKVVVESGNRSVRKEPLANKEKKEYVYQCSHCLTIYDETAGDPANGIAQGTRFDKLPGECTCSLCEAPGADFKKIEKTLLGLQTI